MTHDQIVKQSVACYKQWSKQWREHAKVHSEFKMKSFEDFRSSGIGKAALLVANGYSFEENIETIKKNAVNVDVVACDKTLGHLINAGVKPKFCIVCDANVSYEKYLKPYEDQLERTILIQNVCGNPEWTKNGNWKQRYFYVNKDVMHYEKEFQEISGCPNLVTAGTNVSNMMVVLLTQSDNETRQNLFSYDKLLLIGFDYSWKADGGYYAFDKDAGGKFHYMRHVKGIAPSGKLIYTSNNLSSSSSWLNLYIKAFNIPVVQCSQDSILWPNIIGKLEEQIRYKHKPQDSQKVKDLLNELRGLETRKVQINNRLKSIGREHWLASRAI